MYPLQLAKKAAFSQEEIMLNDQRKQEVQVAIFKPSCPRPKPYLDLNNQGTLIYSC